MADSIIACTPSLADVLAPLPETLEAPACAPSRRTPLAPSAAVEIAGLFDIDFAAAPFSINDLQLGLDLELEQLCYPSLSDSPGDDLVAVGMLVLAHLYERADYYRQLTTAHAPGDPVPLAFQRAEVGAD